MTRMQYQKYLSQVEQKAKQTQLPSIQSLKTLHLVKNRHLELSIDQPEPTLIMKNKDTNFLNHHQMWNQQTSTFFSRQNLKSPAYNPDLHKFPFGYLSPQTRGGPSLKPITGNSQSNLMNGTMMSSSLIKGQTLASYNFRDIIMGQSMKKGSDNIGESMLMMEAQE